MTRPTTLPIARLRDLGCRVHTLIGHDPKHGIWRYGVVLPEPVGPTEFTDITQDAQAGILVRADRAGNRVIYDRVVPRDCTKFALAETERKVAERLASAADYLKERLRHV